MKDSTFRQVRFSLYFALLLSGIMIQWFVPFHYKCSVSGEECFACGLRSAVNLFLQGRFAEAYQSNKLIVAVLAAGLFIATDVFVYLYRRFRRKRHRPPRP